ncbi:P1 family peptidase [Streptomyces sp. S.PNR 29]|uniref:P1 family peptidase n=1 Tax=Streptomyces sp. S.PNR 29 TaxID=2973805 RepID=UPI0025B24B07|nr:P1 family peptidase [Streptomyces sp. S.PNR 29]MDN0193822.1 P1 family peptidase [Streptomyces sp. S.PNR 29]
MTVDALTDVAGVRVGHATRTGDGWLTGTTVVLAPQGGAVAAVDVRGGGPGTKETDALDPRNVVQKVEAVVLTGGSAYGLDAASGVMAWLEEQGRGVRVGVDPAHVVPVVPAACVFDLGRGGDFRARPDAATGRAAVEAAAASAPGTPVREGCVGAGTGATVGPLKGGVGTASTVLESGITVAALVVANAAGSAVDPETGVLYGELFQGRRVEYPEPSVHEAARRRLAEVAESSAPPPLNTTLAVVATDADLSKAQAQKLAGTAHDGIARAVRPVHLLHDGDTVFTLATGERPLDTANPLALNEVLAAGADLVTRAIVRAVRAAESVDGPGGVWPAYGELYGGR